MFTFTTPAGRTTALAFVTALTLGCGEYAGPAAPAHPLTAEVVPATSAELTITPFEIPGAIDGFAAGINPQGDIVGAYYAEGNHHGFLRHGDAYTTIDVPGASSTEALGINPQGDIVGLYFAAGIHGFLLHDGSFATIDVPGFGTPETIAWGINQRNDVVGYSNISAPHGFLLHDGSYSSIDVPGASFTEVRGIGIRGEFVGDYTGIGANGLLGTHGFVLSQGAYTTVDVPGAFITVVTGSTPRGDLVGYYNDAGTDHGFVRPNLRLFHHPRFPPLSADGGDGGRVLHQPHRHALPQSSVTRSPAHREPYRRRRSVPVPVDSASHPGGAG